METSKIIVSKYSKPKFDSTKNESAKQNESEKRIEKI